MKVLHAVGRGDRRTRGRRAVRRRSTPVISPACLYSRTWTVGARLLGGAVAVDEHRHARRGVTVEGEAERVVAVGQPAEGEPADVAVGERGRRRRSRSARRPGGRPGIAAAEPPTVTVTPPSGLPELAVAHDAADRAAAAARACRVPWCSSARRRARRPRSRCRGRARCSSARRSPAWAGSGSRTCRPRRSVGVSTLTVLPSTVVLTVAPPTGAASGVAADHEPGDRRPAPRRG